MNTQFNLLMQILSAPSPRWDRAIDKLNLSQKQLIELEKECERHCECFAQLAGYLAVHNSSGNYKDKHSDAVKVASKTSQLVRKALGYDTL